MMTDQLLPPEIITVLNGEMKDFAVKADRETPFSTALTGVIFGLFWMGFISIFWFTLFGPIFQGREAHFKVNGVATTAGLGHMGALLIPGIFIGIFTLIGLLILGASIKSLFAPGPWFVGTPTRLIIWSPKKFKNLDWEQFTGNIEVKGDAKQADITFEMRTGKMVSRKNAPDQYVPDKIYIAGIPNAMALEELCRKRIKENDPTLPNNK